MMFTRTMKSVVAALLSISLAACTSTFPLASSVRAPDSKTIDQQQADAQACQDKARLATESEQVIYFLIGLTIIGVPYAWAKERAKQREVYGDCMTARGYAVTLAND